MIKLGGGQGLSEPLLAIMNFLSAEQYAKVGFSKYIAYGLYGYSAVVALASFTKLSALYNMVLSMNQS